MRTLGRAAQRRARTYSASWQSTMGTAAVAATETAPLAAAATETALLAAAVTAVVLEAAEAAVLAAATVRP